MDQLDQVQGRRHLLSRRVDHDSRFDIVASSFLSILSPSEVELKVAFSAVQLSVQCRSVKLVYPGCVDHYYPGTDGVYPLRSTHTNESTMKDGLYLLCSTSGRTTPDTPWMDW